MLQRNIVKLRYFEYEDIDLLMQLRSTNESYDFFYEYEPINTQMQKNWWENSTSRSNEKNFIIESVTLNKAIGTAALVHIDFRNRKCEFGRFMIEETLNTLGSAVEAELLALEYAFDHLNMRKVYVEVFTENKEVIRLHKQFGFIQEAYFTEHIYKKGIYKDVMVLALQKSIFKEKSVKIIKTLSRIKRSN